MTDNTLFTSQIVSPNKFRLDIALLDPVQFFIQKTNLPTIRTGSVKTGNPSPNFAYFSGDKAEYDPLIVEFIVDSNFQNWLSVHDWMIGNVNSEPEQKSEGSLFILKNNYAPNLQFVFYDLIPIELVGPIFDASLNEDDKIMMATITFRYTKYSPVLPN